jgi:hypothetical protein
MEGIKMEFIIFVFFLLVVMVIFEIILRKKFNTDMKGKINRFVDYDNYELNKKDEENKK